jgi:hypothetical protein
LWADPIQLLRALQECLTAFADPQWDTAWFGPVLGYIDALGQFPAFFGLANAFSGFQKNARDMGTNFVDQKKCLMEEAGKYEEKRSLSVDSGDEVITREIVPAEKIEQVLQHKSLTKEQKAMLVKFILKKDGFLSDDFLTTEF